MTTTTHKYIQGFGNDIPCLNDGNFKYAARKIHFFFLISGLFLHSFFSMLTYAVRSEVYDTSIVRILGHKQVKIVKHVKSKKNNRDSFIIL